MAHILTDRLQFDQLRALAPAVGSGTLDGVAGQLGVTPSAISATPPPRRR